MRVILRRLPGTEFDAELVALSVLAAAGGFTAAWLMLRLPTPHCVFHAITGLPCLTCGGTRAMRSLLAGDIRAAFEWNPLVFLSIAAAGFFMIYAAIVTAFRLPRIRVTAFTSREGNALRIALGLAAAANWIYLIFRFSHTA